MDRADETILEMATRHVAEGEWHVAHQKTILAELRDHGHPTETAEELLAEFEATLRGHRAHRERLEAQELLRPDVRTIPRSRSTRP